VPIRRRALRALLALCLLSALAVALNACGGEGGQDERPVSDGPNIILIVSDDQSLDEFNSRVMPETTRLLVDEGTVPEDFVVTTPLCCPSRASLLTGQYGHNNGVLANRYELLKNPESTLPVWLHDAGYHTAHFGKYLNNYDKVVKDVGPAPGWDEWGTVVGASYYDYELHLEDRTEEHGDRPSDYLARVITRHARRTIENQASDERPLFMQLDYYEPHPDPSDDKRCGDAALPDPRDADLFTHPKLPRPPSFNERDVSDKPAFQRSLPFTPDKIARITRRFGCAEASLRSVDRGVGEVVEALRKAGELDDTVIAYMSDNGVLRGQHGIGGGKHIAYAETQRVPVALRVPAGVLGGVQPPRGLEGPTANIDLAPTFLDLAGAEPCSAGGDCRVMDGRSLVGALTGKEPLDPARSRLVELDESAKPEKLVGPCRYRGIRTAEIFYVEHEIAQSLKTGECVPVDDRELYDLVEDPFEMENLLPPGGGTPAAEALGAEQAEILEGLYDCQGIAGRDPEPPPGISYCE
jgi:N-acetylglucosamine-6-sulfatase